MNKESKWYIICTKPKLEKRTVEIFEKKQIAVYLPQYNKLQFQYGRKKAINTLLLPSMFFAFLNENQFKNVATISGVTGFMYKLQKPAVIKNKEIFAMQHFLSQHDDVMLEKVTMNSNSDDYTKYINKVEGLLEDKSYDNKELYLPSLGYRLVARSRHTLVTNVA